MGQTTEDLKSVLIEAIEAQKKEAIQQLLPELHAFDIADIYENLSDELKAYFIDFISLEDKVDILPEISAESIETIFEELDDKTQRTLVSELKDDDRVDVLQRIEPELSVKLISLLKKDEQDLTESLLRYDESSAGGRMTTNVGKVHINMSVKEGIDNLRDIYETTGTLARIFVVDDEDKLLGKLRLRDLAFNNWDTPIKSIVQEANHSILANEDQEVAAKLIKDYDLLALPVINEFNQILGVITADDAMEILEQESTEDIEKIAGITGEVSFNPYMQTSIFSHIKKRFPWLFILAITAIFSGMIMMRFESILTNLFLLALYLPMVVSSGGNSGGQASTVIIRAMSLDEISLQNSFKVIWGELRIGAILGCVIGVFIAGLSYVLLPLFDVTIPPSITLKNFSIAIFLAISIQITASNIAGALLPLLARQFKVDPAVIAAPIITTLVDVTGLLIYFWVIKSFIF